MSSVLMVEETFVEAAPDVVFGLFGQGANAGWLFDAECEAVAPGCVVRFRLPVDDGFGEVSALEVNGRIQSVHPGRRIAISYEAPWEGRLVCTLAPKGRGTHVRLVAEVDDAAMAWLLRRRGIPVAEEVDPSAQAIGLLVSQSGSASVFSATTVNLARMAVDEINDDGGLRGRRVRLAVGDDATDPTTGAGAMRRLIEDEGCGVVIACVTSATFRAIQPIAEQAGALLVYPLVNEGGPTGERLFRFGERPADQARYSIPYLMRRTGGRRWYLAGNDYCWPKATNRYARSVISSRGGRVVGERYEPIGTRQFDTLLEQIESTDAELVISTFVGADEVAFERQLYAEGLRDRCEVLALALDENTRSHVGDAGATGLWTVFGYFEQLATAANLGFLDRYRQRFEGHPPPVSSITESVYEAVHLYAAAARKARSLDPLDAGRAMIGRSFDGPRGRVTVRDPAQVHQDLYLAHAVTGGFEIVGLAQ